MAALKKTVQKEEAEHKKLVNRVELVSAQMVKANNDLKEVQSATQQCRVNIHQNDTELDSLSCSLETVKVLSCIYILTYTQ